jgi:hypothetical protein
LQTLFPYTTLFRSIKLSPEKAIFIFVNNVLPPTGACAAPPLVPWRRPKPKPPPP